MEENIEELAVPVCQGLIKPLTVGTAFVIAVRAWYMLPFFFLTHYLLYIACKKDPMVIKIFIKKYIKQKNYFYEG